MRTAAAGDKVLVHYTGRLEDGTVFDSSRAREPLEFTIGEGRLLRGFEAAVEGMAEGQTKTVRIPSAQAYGPRRQELVLRVPRSQFPASIKPEVGLALSVRQPDGGTMEVLVTEVGEEAVTLDANHPLAGRDLEFEIELTRIC